MAVVTGPNRTTATQVDRHEPHSSDVKFTDARIEQMEREMAALRSVRGDQPRSSPGRRP